MYDIAKFQQAISVAHALELLAADSKAMLIAGGSDVLIKLRDGHLSAANLVSIQGLSELKGVHLDRDKTLVIGSGLSFSDICNDELIKQYVPVLAEAVAEVGGPQVRNIGTIGGNVCNGVTSADSAATLFALNAWLRIAGPDGVRQIPISSFYKGPGKVDLRHGEILTAILIKAEDYDGLAGRYIKFAMRSAMDIATLGCVVCCKVENGKTVSDFRLALGVAAPTPIRCHNTENLVKGKLFCKELLDSVGKTAVTEANPRTSWRATREFRLQLIEELSKRAFNEAFIRAGGVA